MNASTAQRYAWFEALKDIQAGMGDGDAGHFTGQPRMDRKQGLR